ncbi:hypothetical protein [Burkholderia plantarii]|uniref:hypothetical protein n=1 Tax=Burkholderia plantarii TaxID=41899 RepID=UPI000F501703|nr:hypothetical protein [Burkholderia plantarii]
MKLRRGASDGDAAVFALPAWPCAGTSIETDCLTIAFRRVFQLASGRFQPIFAPDLRSFPAPKIQEFSLKNKGLTNLNDLTLFLREGEKKIRIAVI